MPTDRPTLKGAVDEDTFDRWHDFARTHGVDIAALLEAIGRRLQSEQPPGWQRQLVADARNIRADRRDRRPHE